jgi:hypothetical protein
MAEQREPQRIFGRSPEQPVVFMFQPTAFEVMTPDRLTEWENLLQEKVGLEGRAREGRVSTLSYCDTRDDCDTAG